MTARRKGAPQKTHKKKEDETKAKTFNNVSKDTFLRLFVFLAHTNTETHTHTHPHSAAKTLVHTSFAILSAAAFVPQ